MNMFGDEDEDDIDCFYDTRDWGELRDDCIALELENAMLRRRIALLEEQSNRAHNLMMAGEATRHNVMLDLLLGRHEKES